MTSNTNEPFIEPLVDDQIPTPSKFPCANIGFGGYSIPSFNGSVMNVGRKGGYLKVLQSCLCCFL